MIGQREWSQKFRNITIAIVRFYLVVACAAVVYLVVLSFLNKGV